MPHTFLLWAGSGMAYMQCAGMTKPVFYKVSSFSTNCLGGGLHSLFTAVKAADIKDSHSGCQLRRSKCIVMQRTAGTTSQHIMCRLCPTTFTQG